jgi:hypothetical protein
MDEVMLARLIPLVVVVAVMPFVSLHAQHEHDVQLRNDCRLALQVLEHGQPANRYEWALDVIVDCGAEGAQALAAELRQVGEHSTPSPRLDFLADRATMVIDSAIFNAALEVALDRTAGEAGRVYALSVVYTQVTHGYQPYRGLVMDYGPGGTIMIDWPASTAEPPVRRVLPTDAPQRALNLLQVLAHTDPNPVVREAARRVCTGIKLSESGDQITEGCQ